MRMCISPATPLQCYTQTISCKVKVNRCFTYYVHSSPELVILIPTSTTNPIRKSVVLESSAKPSIGCLFGGQGMLWPKIEEQLTQNNPHYKSKYSMSNTV